jgi:phage tail tape-measure protein
MLQMTMSGCGGGVSAQASQVQLHLRVLPSYLLPAPGGGGGGGGGAAAAAAVSGSRLLQKRKKKPKPSKEALRKKKRMEDPLKGFRAGTIDMYYSIEETETDGAFFFRRSKCRGDWIGGWRWRCGWRRSRP